MYRIANRIYMFPTYREKLPPPTVTTNSFTTTPKHFGISHDVATIRTGKVPNNFSTITL